MNFEKIRKQHDSTTKQCCFAALHPGAVDPKALDDHMPYMQRLKDDAGLIAARSFNGHERLKTLPATFKAYFDLYRNSLGMLVYRMFWEFLEIARANKLPSLVEFAKAEQLTLIDGINVERWIKDVCYKQPLTEDLDTAIEWADWRAPFFLAMVPSGITPYDPAQVWELRDEPTSRWHLKYLSDRFRDGLKMQLENAAGQACIELAKEPIPNAPDIIRIARTRKSPPHLAKRNKVVLDAIEAKLTGIEYSRYLDKQISIPTEWAKSGCPPTFEKAYLKKDDGLYVWRKRIQDMKTKVRRSFRTTPPHEGSRKSS